MSGIPRSQPYQSTLRATLVHAFIQMTTLTVEMVGRSLLDLSRSVRETHDRIRDARLYEQARAQALDAQTQQMAVRAAIDEALRIARDRMHEKAKASETSPPIEGWEKFFEGIFDGLPSQKKPTSPAEA